MIRPASSSSRSAIPSAKSAASKPPVSRAGASLPRVTLASRGDNGSTRKPGRAAGLISASTERMAPASKRWASSTSFLTPPVGVKRTRTTSRSDRNVRRKAVRNVPSRRDQGVASPAEVVGSVVSTPARASILSSVKPNERSASFAAPNASANAPAAIRTVDDWTATGAGRCVLSRAQPDCNRATATATAPKDNHRPRRPTRR